MFLAATAVAVPLLGCATPEELAIQQQRRERTLQTGTNIARTDGRGRADAVTDKDSQDAMLNDMRNVSQQSLAPKPGTP
jgi:hypothetical protein